MNDLSNGVGARFVSEVEEGNLSDAGAGVAVKCPSCADSGEGPPRGVPECLERRLDLVAEGNGVESTPPRLVRDCCLVVNGVC
jgi:hypothetical protein